MSLETQMEILNNNLRQLMLMMDDGMVILSGGKIDMPSTDAPDTISDNSAPTSPVKSKSMFAPETSTGDLPKGDIDWNDLDAMDCPYHDGMMSGTRSKNKTGPTKGCWSKARNKEYTEEMYLNDRRTLIEMWADKMDAGEIDDDGAEAETSESATAPQAGGAPPQAMAPQVATELKAIDDPKATFVEVCEASIAEYGIEILQDKLHKCGLSRDYDYESLDGESENPEIAPWIKAELAKHHVTASA